MNDILLNKITTIERCTRRIQEVYEENPNNLIDYTKQDNIILNIQRAYEAGIDLAMYLVSKYKLGVPKTDREAFKLLLNAKMIDTKLTWNLMNMVGFRNIAVHDYQALDPNILQTILKKHIDKFTIGEIKRQHGTLSTLSFTFYFTP